MDSQKSDYSQHHSYHFNEDSIRLVRYCVEKYRDFNINSCLDYCCGSGVVGLEISQEVSINHLVFYDIQPHLEKHLDFNIKKFSKAKRTDYFLNMRSHIEEQKFDLIVMNPPYYLESSSRLPEDEKRRKSRFYKKGELKKIFKSVLSNLDSKANLIFCIKPDKFNLSEIDFLLNDEKKYEVKTSRVNDLSIFDITLFEDKGI